MSENLLAVLPQLDDYTCPVCASITFKPSDLPLLIQTNASTTLMWTCILHPMPYSPTTPEKISVSDLSTRSRYAS